jgi:hypothetical protein
MLSPRIAENGYDLYVYSSLARASSRNSLHAIDEYYKNKEVRPKFLIPNIGNKERFVMHIYLIF